MNIKPSILIGRSLVVLAFGLLASGTVRAQGLYVYGAVGKSSVDFDKSSIDTELTNLGVTGLSSSVDDSDTGYKLQLGYMFNRHVGVEGGWVDLGKFRYNANFNGGSAVADVKASGFSMAAIGVAPLNESASLFAKLGIINAKVKTSASASGPGGAASANVSDTDWSPNYGLGFMYSFTPKLALRVEWDRFDNLGNKDKTGEGDVDLYSVGLKYSF